GIYQIPISAVDNNGEVYAYQNAKWTKIKVDIQQELGDEVRISTQNNLTGISIATNHRHKLVGYSPGKSADYMGTLANPIIILFLGGFMIAEAAVKYNFDKNLTKYLLRPFGSKPK